jgi:hypothetical protein
VITASAEEIDAIIGADPELMAALRAFMAGAGDGDLSGVLRALPQAVGAHAPFETEQDVVEAVKREKLILLHTMALYRLPVRGHA